jgi:hypothetical protein
MYMVTEMKYLERRNFLWINADTLPQVLYCQAICTVIEQEMQWSRGRAAYMYSGWQMCGPYRRQAYIDAIERIWENMVTKKNITIKRRIGATIRRSFGKFSSCPIWVLMRNVCGHRERVCKLSLVPVARPIQNYDVWMDFIQRLISGVSIEGGFLYPPIAGICGQHQRQPGSVGLLSLQ